MSKLVLDRAQELEFIVPFESGTHIHFDGKPFQNTRSFRSLVQGWKECGERLKTEAEPNPLCTRLGPWPKEFSQLVLSNEFLNLNWHEAQQQILNTGLVKWCDFNVLNIVDPHAEKCTAEFRFLATSFEAANTVAIAKSCEAFLRRSVLDD